VVAQAPPSLRRTLLVLLLAVTALAAPAMSGAHRPSAASLRAQDAAIEAKSRAAVLDLYSLDDRLSAARSRLETLRGRLAALQHERATLRRARAIASHSTRLAQRNLARRLRLLYERGEVEPLEILLGARSLDDALTSLDNLTGATKQDTAILRAVVAARSQYVSDAAALAARTAELDAATHSAAATAASLEEIRAQRAGYIASLRAQRRLNEGAIAALEGEAQAAVQRSAPSSAPARAAVTAAPPAGGRTFSVSATAYSLSGYTSSGLPVGWGVVAVDPSVIPLGTHLYVPGYGEAVAADTGSAIIGNRIDVWFPTLAQAEAWGLRVVTITIQ
jgi:3D (Asp-Asp-Asp) domain-containing protein